MEEKQIYIVDSHTNFNKYFSLFESNIKETSNPTAKIIGFDTERINKSNFPESYNKADWVKNKCNEIVCTIKIANENICLIICLKDLGKDLPNKLVKLITSESWIKVGIGVSNDLRFLSQNYNLGHCLGAIDILSLSYIAHVKSPNLSNLSKIILNKHITKTHAISDWSLDLNKNLIHYAAQDAFASYMLFMRIINPTITYLKNIDQHVNGDDFLDKYMIHEHNYTNNIDTCSDNGTVTDENHNVNSNVNSNVNNNNDYISLLKIFCDKNKQYDITYQCIDNINTDAFIMEGAILKNDKQLFKNNSSGMTKRAAKHSVAKLLYKYISNLN